MQGKVRSDKKFKMEASLDPHRRFEWGVPPASKGDYAFVQHMLYSLAENGRMATILPHGVLFRGASEGKIRKQIIELNLIRCRHWTSRRIYFTEQAFQHVLWYSAKTAQT